MYNNCFFSAFCVMTSSFVYYKKVAELLLSSKVHIIDDALLTIERRRGGFLGVFP